MLINSGGGILKMGGGGILKMSGRGKLIFVIFLKVVAGEMYKSTVLRLLAQIVLIKVK